MVEVAQQSRPAERRVDLVLEVRGVPRGIVERVVRRQAAGVRRSCREAPSRGGVDGLECTSKMWQHRWATTAPMGGGNPRETPPTNN